MDPSRFDRLSKLFATRRTRRQAVVTVAGLAATGLAASIQRGVTAQHATPIPHADPHPSADSAGTDSEFLFVQPFEGGTWTPKAGEEDVYTLTLSGIAAQTTFFSDRPERITGLTPTGAFLDGLGFDIANPPNAAIVALTDSGEQDVLVMELFSPVYDAEDTTLSYEASVLSDYDGRGIAHLAQQQTDYELSASFGPGSLFIDDCPDVVESCYNWAHRLGPITVGTCWSWEAPGCIACRVYSAECKALYPEQGDDPDAWCTDDVGLCGKVGCCEGREWC
jgi:hypothetical protein